MKTYCLNSLLDIRVKNDNKAQIFLKNAFNNYYIEQEKFYKIEALLKKTKNEIVELNENFLKDTTLNQNPREYLSLSFFTQKKINEEQRLKEMLCVQKEKMNEAMMHYNKAMEIALLAKQKLKMIEKHYETWQKQEKKVNEIKIDYENDDRNNLNFFINSKG